VKDEPVDVLDKQGRKTGQILMKSKVHAQSCWHAVAHLWIYNSNDEFLLQKRAPDKQVWPNVWDVTMSHKIYHFLKYQSLKIKCPEAGLTEYISHLS
jgi:isopentenyl-diphosphate delta-isomerase